MTLELAEKACTRCGETKPLTEFHRNRRAKDGLNSWCKTCNTAGVRAAQERRREEMGDEEYRRHRSIIVTRSRARRGMASERRYNRARSRAISELVEAHRKEYDALLDRALYEIETDEGAA